MTQYGSDDDGSPVNPFAQDDDSDDCPIERKHWRIA